MDGTAQGHDVVSPGGDVADCIDDYRRPISGPGANRIVLEIRAVVTYSALTVVAVTSLIFVLPSKLRGNDSAERGDDPNRAYRPSFDTDTEEETWLRENV
jgi:hypothetical protein